MADLEPALYSVNPVDSNPFNTLPFELKLLIFGYLSVESDIKNLSYTSIALYRACFFIRFPSKTLSIGLTPSSVKLFQRGRLLDHLCADIRSIRLKVTYNGQRNGSPSVLYDRLQANRELRIEEGSKWDVDATFSQLRELLDVSKMFPNLQTFCVGYEIPGAAENNTFLAILKNIPVPGKLEYVEFQAVKFQEIKPHPHERSEELYQEMFQRLSEPNRSFLGAKVPDSEMNYLVLKNSPSMPNVKTFKISTNALAAPWLHARSECFLRNGFYYLPLSTMPRAESIIIRTTDTNRLYDPYGFPVKSFDDALPELPDEFTKAFSRMTALNIVADDEPGVEDFQRLVRRFPNLTNLSIDLYPTDVNVKGQSSLHYELLPLKRLRELSLPWPQDYVEKPRRYHRAFCDMCGDLQAAGLGELTRVKFRGRSNLRRPWGGVFKKNIVLRNVRGYWMGGDLDEIYDEDFDDDEFSDEMTAEHYGRIGLGIGRCGGGEDSEDDRY